MSLKHINESQFDSVINEDLVLIDFYADWCGPCKMMGQVLESMKDDRGINIVKINVDENNDLARKIGIMSIPTLMIYSKGIIKEKKMGFVPKEELIEWIEKNK